MKFNVTDAQKIALIVAGIGCAIAAFVAPIADDARMGLFGFGTALLGAAGVQLSVKGPASPDAR